MATGAVLILTVLLLVACTAAVRWRLHIRRLNAIIEEQRSRIEALTHAPIAVEEQVRPEPGPAGIRLPAAEALNIHKQPADGDVQKGIRAFMRGDYWLAAEILPGFAGQDHVKAQTILAKMYFSGNGVDRDMRRYEYWLQRAADNGHKPSKAKLKKLRKAAE